MVQVHNNIYKSIPIGYKYKLIRLGSFKVVIIIICVKPTHCRLLGKMILFDFVLPDKSRQQESF